VIRWVTTETQSEDILAQPNMRPPEFLGAFHGSAAYKAQDALVPHVCYRNPAAFDVAKYAYPRDKAPQ
jgi:hypothetical protein